MNTSQSAIAADLEDRFGRRVAARLSAGSRELPHDISERLRVARLQAVAQRKQEARPSTVAVSSGPALALGGGWFNRIASALPLVALAAGLVAISVVQDDRRANELAEVDAALLTDELPPAAYTDPGFAQFLKSEATVQR